MAPAISASFRAGEKLGGVLRLLRKSRRFSQLELAGRANISTRHLSFLETGRARPSAAMVSNLSLALAADEAETDRLRVAAGFCTSGNPQPSPAADLLLESALQIQEATTLTAIANAARPALDAFGASHFFFAELVGQARGKPVFTWFNPGSFPDKLLPHYDRERFAVCDPLLAAADRTGGCFFWADVLDRRNLSGEAKRLFDGAFTHGLRSGFVASHRRPNSTRLVSMMGAAIDQQAQRTRVALEIMGDRMLARIARLNSLADEPQPTALPPT